MALQQCGTCKTELTAGRLRTPAGIYYTNGKGLRIALILPGEEFCCISCVVRRIDEELSANAEKTGHVMLGYGAPPTSQPTKPFRFTPNGSLDMEVSHEDS